MAAEPECIFCRIIDGSAPSTPVYEDDDVLAFLDIRPLSRGHTLIIPKVHASGLSELDPAIGGKVFRVAQQVALGQRRSDLGVDGVNLMLADGRAAMQTVFHVHVHAVPRRNGDKLNLASRMLLRRGGNPPGTADLIREGMGRLGAEG